MAKASKEEKEVSADSKNVADTLKFLDSLNPEASFIEDSALSNPTFYHDTGCYALNAIMTGSCRGGGVPNGRIVGFAGESQTGKTLIINRILGEAQKKGMTVVIWDTESSISKDSVRGMLDPKKTKYLPVQTISECRNQISKFLDRVIAAGQQNSFIISIDSLGNLSSTKEMNDIEKDSSAMDQGTRSREMKSFFRALTYKAAKAGCSIIFSNHTYADPTSMYPTLVKRASSGSGPEYMSSILVQLSRRNEKEGEGDSGALEGKMIAEANRYPGCTLRALTTKNRFIPPFLEVEIYLSFTKGLNKYSGLLTMAEARGIVVKEGLSYAAGVTYSRYKAGEKLGRTSAVAQDVAFHEDYLIPLLDEKIKTDYSFHKNEPIGDEITVAE